MLLPCPLHTAARRHADTPALVTASEIWSYATLEARVQALTAHLEAQGIEEGARVALCLPNQPAAVVWLLALLRRGAVAGLLSTRLPPKALHDQVAQIGATVLVSDRATLFEPAFFSQTSDLPPPTGERPSAADPATSTPMLDGTRGATLVFTSGSTGMPKAALHSLNNHLFSARGANANLPLQQGHRWLWSLPLYHVGGLGIVFRCLLAGATLVIPEPGEPLDAALSRYAVTHVSLVTTQLIRLLEAPPARHQGLQALLLGGSAHPSGLLEAACGRGWPVYTSYGLTEMASQVTATPPGASRVQLQTSGRLLPYRALRIAPDGEILVRGATLFKGYLVAGVRQTAVADDGWFPTGDLGWMDEAGFLHVTGRRDHLFISGGENIQPEEIEALLTGLPGVVQAAVVPVPHPAFGFRPVAFVQTDPLPPDAQHLSEQLAAILPRFKVPAAFYPWPAHLPEGSKVDRRLLEAEARRLLP
jgi:O-succinylbenzoic acid--CoA ligase